LTYLIQNNTAAAAVEDEFREMRIGELEIQVANLWPNRMIGDAALPESQRFTWSSWEPFTKDTPLLKSGLLGPVALSTSDW
jgi:hypothetical protein